MKSFLRAVMIVQLLIMLIVSIGASHNIGSFGTPVSTSKTEQTLSLAFIPSNRVFLNQTFDAETNGAIPANWTILNPQYGNISVVNSTWYGSSSTGKSAMILDWSADKNPIPYRSFSQQTGTVVVSFAIKLRDGIGIRNALEIYVDDSNFDGANIIFKNGQIGYQTRNSGFSVLRTSYAPDRWYKTKLVLNIPQNSYNIYIDDYLEQADATFTGPCTQINRILFNETSGQDNNFLPVAFLDEILGVQGIEIPKDYATIQEGINAASRGDLVFVTKQRTYFETVTIPAGKDGIWLCGEDANTTIIDVSFAYTGQNIVNGITVHASNVNVTGFTVRSTPYGAGISVDGTNDRIENNIVINGLSDGIDISGSNNTVTSSNIKMNLKTGVHVSGSWTTLIGNIIESNDEHGMVVSSWNSDVEDNIIRSNLGCGIQIFQGEQNLIRNNTVKKNGIGIECDAGARNNLIYQNRFINNTQQASNADATNTWDDGYPYVPEEEVGGGNFWSDFNSLDTHSGRNQDQLLNGSLPAPDGLCDKTYILSPKGADNYPLFLIQDVTQDPSDLTKIDYTASVNVTATILKSVDVADAHLEVQYDSTRQNISMVITGNKLKGTIPALKFGTNVTFNVTAHVDGGEVLVHSTNYPQLGLYTVGDHAGPTIGVPITTPTTPIINQTISIAVNVTEPQNASGVNRVYVTCWFLNKPWSADMNATGNNSYSIVVPPQAWDGTLNMSISAVDNAGNLNSRPAFSVAVNEPSELAVSYKNVTYTDSLQIDLGVMSRGQKLVDKNMKISNVGAGALFWSINAGNDSNWIKITPSNCTTMSGSSNVTTISVDTTALVTDSYTAMLAVDANGTVSHYLIVVEVTVRDIMIDDSYASIDVGGRCDVSTIQFYGFHAIWAHNGTDVTYGRVMVNGIGWLDLNATGWANFNDTSQDPAKRTYYVKEVNCTYFMHSQPYSVISLTQKVANLTTIWDRVKIILAVSTDRINVGSEAEILWNSSIYESDNALFEGTVHFNDTLTKNEAGTYYITASSITDGKYGLTQFQSNTVACTWEGTSAFSMQNLQMPLWAIVSIALTLGFGMVATLIILIRSTGNQKSRKNLRTSKR